MRKPARRGRSAIIHRATQSQLPPLGSAPPSLSLSPTSSPPTPPHCTAACSACSGGVLVVVLADGLAESAHLRWQELEVLLAKTALGLAEQPVEAQPPALDDFDRRLEERSGSKSA